MHLVYWEHISPCPIGGSSEPCSVDIVKYLVNKVNFTIAALNSVPDARPGRKLATLVLDLHGELARRRDDDRLGSLHLLASAGADAARVDEAACRDGQNF